MTSVTAVGRHLVDVATILVLGLVYVVALTLGTAGTAIWNKIAAVWSLGQAIRTFFDRDRQPTR